MNLLEIYVISEAVVFCWTAGQR